MAIDVEKKRKCIHGTDSIGSINWKWSKCAVHCRNAHSIFILTVDNKFQFNSHTRCDGWAVAVQHEIERTVQSLLGTFYFLLASNHHDIFMFATLASEEFERVSDAMHSEVSEWLWTVSCFNNAMPVLNSTLINSKFVSLEAHWMSTYGLVWHSEAAAATRFRFSRYGVACFIPIHHFNWYTKYVDWCRIVNWQLELLLSWRSAHVECCSVVCAERNERPSEPKWYCYYCYYASSRPIRYQNGFCGVHANGEWISQCKCIITIILAVAAHHTFHSTTSATASRA